MERPSWDETFMAVAEVMRQRSTCLRRQVGAVIAKNHRIIAEGYNGAPPGFRHCEEVVCLREELGVPSGERHEICRGLHAEMNAILQVAVLGGQSIERCTLYTTDCPCSICARMIAAVGIKRVVFKGDYPDEFTLGILAEAEVELVKFEKGEER